MTAAKTTGRAKVLLCLKRAQAPLTEAEIATRTGILRSSVHSAVWELILKKGAERIKVRTGAGREAWAYVLSGKTLPPACALEACWPDSVTIPRRAGMRFVLVK